MSCIYPHSVFCNSWSNAVENPSVASNVKMSDEERESDDNEIIFAKKLHHVVIFSSSKEEEENVEEWHDLRGDQPNLTTFTGSSGFRIENLNVRSDVTIATCYELFVLDKLFEEIAEQTNL